MKAYHNAKASKRQISHFPPQRHYRPGDPLPPPHIKVDGWETLRRHAEAFEQHQRDEQARMDRAGRRAAA
jgi:hypothetical protein